MAFLLTDFHVRAELQIEARLREDQEGNEENWVLKIWMTRSLLIQLFDLAYFSRSIPLVFSLLFLLSTRGRVRIQVQFAAGVPEEDQDQ